MRHANDSRRWGLVMGALALGTTVLGTSCLQVDTGHCMFAGGDSACGDAAFCVGAVGGRSDAIASADAQGCIEALPAEGPSWVHVEHGLPTTTAVVEGLVARLLDARGLSFDPSRPGCRARLEGLGDLAGIHDRLLREDGRRTTVRDITFSRTEREQITAFNAAIAAALAEFQVECALDPGTTGTTTGPDATTTEQTSTTADLPCTSHDECTDPEAPFCGVLGECGTCDGTEDPNGACAGRDPMRSICDNGVCVQCTPEDSLACTMDMPICDGATNTCTGCTAHAQCGEAACNLFDGDCLADAVVHVGPGQPFATLGDAVDTFAEEARGTIVVHAGPPDYNESVLVGGGRVLAFLAADLGPGVEPPRWVRTSGNTAQLTVGAGTTVLMDGLQLSTNASSSVPALRVTGRAWLDRSRVVDNNGGGIVADGTALVLRNCFVGGNGSGGAGSFGIDVDGADVRILYSTIARNDEEMIDSLRCAGGTIDVRNSILVGRDASSIDCPRATISNSALDEDIGDNANVGAAVLGWFVNATAGDFHLTPSGAATFGDIALWTLGDPTTDIDGDPRPSTTETPDFAGADVP